MAKKAREVMSEDCQCIGVGENDSLLDAAKRLGELNVGSMPICGDDDRLKGMLTDRDITIKVVRRGGRTRKTSTKVELARGQARHDRSGRFDRRGAPMSCRRTR